MGNFSGRINLQPNTVMDYTFYFPAASSATANDGFFPYNTTISDVTVNGYDEDGTSCTSALISGTPAIVDNKITVTLKYPGTTGRYKIEFVMTLNDGNKDEAEFSNIFAVDH